jgi:tetratricopeptide (TPR) repeat protein
LLLSAAEALSVGRPIEAAALYREARTVCQTAGLVEQEAAVLMALGGACLAARVPDLGAESYQRAAVLAEQVEAWPLACQAWLGMGGAHLLRAEHAAATVAYRSAARVAKRARIVPLRAEALRMAGTCLSRLGLDDEAIRAWNEAADARGA